jgi:hypothetical protein
VRRAASVALAAVVALGAAGCGGGPSGQRSLDRFLAGAQGRTWSKRYPHRPGSEACTARDPAARAQVPATCSTDLWLGTDHRVIVTFTESWSHGSRARTWFVHLRRDGSVSSIERAGSTR